MRNGEVKRYRGKTITKVSGTCWMVPGFINYFGSYYEAKEAIDAAMEEDRALDEIEARVQALGGYL